MFILVLLPPVIKWHYLFRADNYAFKKRNLHCYRFYCIATVSLNYHQIYMTRSHNTDTSNEDVLSLSGISLNQGYIEILDAFNKYGFLKSINDIRNSFNVKHSSFISLNIIIFQQNTRVQSYILPNLA
jgi:hypothetical protein